MTQATTEAMSPEEMADGLDRIEAASICHIGDCANGWWIHGGGANWVAVSLLERRYPRLLFTGFDKDRDPDGTLVTLTNFGHSVRNLLLERAQQLQGEAGPKA